MEQHHFNLTQDKKFQLHIDGSHYDTFNLAAGGGCLLDGEKVIHSFVDLVPIHIPFNFHEYFALSNSLQNCLKLGVKNIEVQTDCLSLLEDIEKFQNGHYVSDKNLEVLQKLNIFPMINQFNSFSLKHVLRKQNCFADYLVGQFLDNYISTNKINKLFENKQNVYHNDSKFYHSPEKTITKNYLKNIQNQVVIFLMFNNVDEIKIKFLYYDKSDINCLVKQHNVCHSSKKWGDKVASELASFLDSLNINECRISSLGTFQNKIFDYIRPNSKILHPKVADKIDNIYQKFDVISFSSFTDFTVKVKNEYENEYQEYIHSQQIKSDKPKLSPQHKHFLFVALKTLGENDSVAENFIKENKNHELIKDISHLSIIDIQKNIFDKFLNHLNQNNLSQYLKQKENLKKNGINFKF